MARAQGREGKIVQVYRKKWVIHIERITREKVNGERPSCLPSSLTSIRPSITRDCPRLPGWRLVIETSLYGSWESYDFHVRPVLNVSLPRCTGQDLAAPGVAGMPVQPILACICPRFLEARLDLVLQAPQ